MVLVRNNHPISLSTVAGAFGANQTRDIPADLAKIVAASAGFELVKTETEAAPNATPRVIKIQVGQQGFMCRREGCGKYSGSKSARTRHENRDH